MPNGLSPLMSHAKGVLSVAFFLYSEVEIKHTVGLTLGGLEYNYPLLMNSKENYTAFIEFLQHWKKIQGSGYFKIRL